MSNFVTKLRYIDNEERVVQEDVAWWSWSILDIESGAQMIRDVIGREEAQRSLATSLHFFEAPQ